MTLPWLEHPVFPATHQALVEPNGLLAAGGELTVEWLLAAYRRGIFPWFNEGDPILWWSPSPRLVFYPDQVHISRSLRKVLKKGGFRVSINRDFAGVITHCAELKRKPYQEEAETWITAEINQAYIDLHRAGYAHSVEVWREEELVGGLYGVALGKVFFGESMFSKMTNGSKIAISYLAEWLKQWHYRLIDCQVSNAHLLSLGAVEISRPAFEGLLKDYGVVEDGAVKKEWIARELTGEFFI